MGVRSLMSFFAKYEEINLTSDMCGQRHESNMRYVAQGMMPHLQQMALRA